MDAPHTVVIAGLDADPEGEVFSNDLGTWNVSKARRDCVAGKHACYRFSVAEAIAANQGVEIDEAKLTAFAERPELLAKPLLVVMEHGLAWLIDGHHRLHALARRGEGDFVAYVIEEADGARYRVLFNGERHLPWCKKGPQ